MTSQYEFSLGRLEAPDERDLPFRIEERLLVTPVHRVTKHWPLFIKPLNQGAEGTCVGHGWRHWLQAAPTIQTAKYPSAVSIYDAAILVDEWTQNDWGDRQFGTSVRAGAKVLKASGLISEYNMTRDLRTIADWIGGKDALGNFVGGPLVLGTNWYSSMFQTDSEGFVNISGSVAGGHCWDLLGWNEKTQVYYAVNSWGPNWGVKGRFKIRANDLLRLMTEGGEAWTAQEVRI